MVNLIIFCIFIQPWIFLPFPNIMDQFRLPQAAFMDMIFMAIITLFIFSGKRFTYRNKFLAYLVGWLFFGFFASFFVPFSLNIKGIGRALNVWNLEPFIHFILGLFASLCVLSHLEKIDYIRIAKALTISSALVGTFAILQYIGLDPLGSMAKYNCGNKVSACLDNPNLVGNYLVLSIPLFFMFKNRLNFLFMALTCGGLYCSKSRLAVGLLFLALWISYFLKYRSKTWVRTILLLLMLVVIATGTYYLHEKTYYQYNEISSGRLKTYEIAWQGIVKNPVIGYGLGVWRQQIPYIVNTWWTVIHNDWLELWLGMGLIGISLLILVIVNAVRKIDLQDNVARCFLCVFAVFLFMMIFSFPLETSTIAIPGLISWWAIEHKEELL